jgi:hypothetical protein
MWAGQLIVAGLFGCMQVSKLNSVCGALQGLGVWPIIAAEHNKAAGFDARPF